LGESLGGAMHKVTFFPVGNADCCRVDLACGTKMLFDYANYEHKEDDDLRTDLAADLLADLKQVGRNYFDVVAFTHADDDHIHGSSEFFFLEHAEKYQSDQRIKINELWVPAAMILEEGAEDEARILRTEARHRLKKGKGIKVFSRPDRLKDWLESQNISFEERKHLVVSAGQLIPGFNKSTQGIEIFVHSPFSKHTEENTEIDRNESSLILQATFSTGKRESKFIIIGDTDYSVLSDIVNISKFKKNEDRLSWDIFDIPHHCSYKALNEEPGKDKTEPVPEVKWLFEQGAPGSILVSPSDIIPDKDSTQPPHRQAANYYRSIATAIDGDFVVTMEYPKSNAPEPLTIVIDDDGVSLKKDIGGSSFQVISRPAARAG
jgi:hypothetical protein